MPFDDLLGQTAHVLDQDDAQGDRDGPKLADHQRLDLLIGLDKALEDRAGHQAVGVGNIGPGQAKDPRVARERTVGELRQLTVIARRQVVMDLAQLLFHEVEVVQQPFGCRGDRLTGLQGLRAGAVGLQQDIGVFPDPAA